MLDIKRIPSPLLKVLRNETDYTDEQIAESTPEQLLNEWLEWDGIIGYTDLIVGHLDDLRDAVVKKDPLQDDLDGFQSLDVE